MKRTNTNEVERTTKARNYHNKVKAVHFGNRNSEEINNVIYDTLNTVERLCKRNGQYTNEHLISVDGKNALDKIADEITAKTSYRVNIDYNKKKLTVKSDKLIARIYVSANHYRISNYMNGTKVKQTANSFEELLEKIA